MRKEHELNIEIDATGRVTVHVKGVKGRECIQISEQIASMLGPIVSRERTEEYYEVEHTTKAQAKEEQRLGRGRKQK